MSLRSCATLLLLSCGSTALAAESAPRLAVVVSVDQLKADHLVRLRPHFGAGGFKRLLADGADFQNCHYRHAITQTAPGHGVILSGVYPNVHSVIGNEWIDRDTWEQVNSVEDRDSPLVGMTPRELGPAAAARPDKTGRSPRNFTAMTVGDQLKARYGADCKVIAASNKDRSAILLGGQRADAAYWDEVGKMVTTRYYRAALPAWVEAFNQERRVFAAFGQTWERLLAPAVYEALVGPDDAPGENDSFGFGRTFPKKVNGGKAEVSPAFFTAFDNSPFSTEVLGAFVQRAVREEKLGQHPGTDLLGVSFSQVDAVGHSYGPDSHEVMDSMLRLDRVLAELFGFFDREIGVGRWVVVLTADHGVASLPERTVAAGAGGGRVNTRDLDSAVKKALDRAYGPLTADEVWFVRDGSALHLRPAALAQKNVAAAAAAAVAREALARQACVAQAFTREEILAAPPEGDSVLAMVRRSYHAGRGRDVLFVLKPNFIMRNNTGTTHGTPHDYDTHVALLWHGPGVPQGVRTERVGVEDIAPTLAALLGVPAPAGAQGRRLF
jgi:predicted AlkP superfamily pyrophosphatase or phosphodiesterase